MTAASDAMSVLSNHDRTLLRAAGHPRWVDPMLATLADKSFSSRRWLFERKLDGIRCISYRDGDEVRLLSRNRQRLENSYPEVVDAIASQSAADFVLDGEIVAFERGRTSFERLQQRSGITDPARARQSAVAVRYYVFDIVHLEGNDTRALPLRTRKRLLRLAIDFDSPIHFTSHRNTEGDAYFAYACEHGWEGIIAKRADSTYSSRRSANWLKFKCGHSQELVIAGFTEPRGTRVGFGALLVGYFRGEDFVHAGKVGTGFGDDTLRELRGLLDQLEVPEAPFTAGGRFDRGTHFVKPELVAEVGFTEWTRDGMLRHPRFLGLRRDKPAREVVREVPLDHGHG